MGKPSKKANDQVAVAPVSLPEEKSGKKGKREAGVALKKAISAKKQKVVEAKKVKAPPPKEDEESSSSEEDISEPEEEEKVAPEATERDGSSEEEDDSADEEEPNKAEQKKSDGKEDDSEDDGSSEEEEESGDEEPTKTPKKDTDVVMKDKPSANSNGKAKSDKKEPKTPVGKQSESGTTTIFVGNLPFKADEDEIAAFFKEAGEVIHVRLATSEDGRPRGFGHVEFATEEAAKKAVEMKQLEFMGRELRLDLAHPRNKDNEKGGKGASQTVFVKGFDKTLEEDEIRSKLQEHFGSCGEITRLSVPTDRESGAIRGIAYMDFKDADALSKACDLSGSDLDGFTLTVDQAPPRDGGGRSGGRSGGRGGSRGGRFSGGRGGSRGRGGQGGRGGRGKKRSFGDD